MDYERPPPPHNRTTSISNSASSELFICFTSRLSSSSSSSMKLSSKSILSPGRTDKQISLSASLSRRLRNNGSIKGGQSPMFPTGAKKRGSGFENTEPTSPKVTCIGQVRVKTKKKQAMKMRSMSKRRGSSGEASFRRIEQKQLDQNHHHHQHQHSGYLQQQLQQSQSQHQQQQQDGLQQRNQKWVHLPLTICEALRAFGAEFNCFLPCRSSCMSSERDQKDKMNHGSSSIDDGDQNSTRSCGAVFARWLVAMQEGEGKTREIELVVGGEEEEEGTERRSYHRRHVMEGIDINEVEKCNAEKIGVVEEGEGGEQGRVSICVPPKNALLLMRCRSDPLRMAALANRFWESPVTKDEDFEDIKDEDDEERDHGNEQEEEEEDMKEILEKEESLEVVLETEHEIVCKFEELVVHEAGEEECGVSEDTTNLVIMEVNEQVDTQESFQEINHYEEEIAEIEEEEEEEEDKEEDDEVKAAELMSDSSPEALADPESQESEVIEAELVQEKEENDGEFEEDEERRVSLHSSVSPLSIQSEKEEENQEMEAVAESETTMVRPLEEEEEEETEKSTMEKETTQSPSSEEEETTVTHQRSEPEIRESIKEEEEEAELERESHQQQPINLVRESRSTTTLPDCLLLMMCEPKLSMEVSKETWVCSTDFIRCVPSTAEKKKVIKTDGRDAPKRRVSIDSHPGVATRKKVLLQPPRSSCSFPTAAVAAAAQGVSMATMIEQKLGNSVAYEPFVLKRCKSEPMRNAAKFAQPEACFWKNRKLEPHHRGAAVGVGAAGIGF